MMNLYKLEIFAAVAREGSFSRAAELLFMTQAAVSQHIHDLEESLGTPLFIRRPGRTRLTPAGQILLGYAHKILFLVASAEAELTEVKNLPHGSLQISAVPHAAAHLLPVWIRTFESLYPHLNAAVQSDPNEAVVRRVLSGGVELGFCDSPPSDPQIKSLRLPNSGLGIAIHVSHRLAQHDTISIRYLHETEFIARPARHTTRAWTNQLFRSFDVEPVVIRELEDPYEILEAVRTSHASTLLPRYFTRQNPDIRVLPIRETPAISSDVYLIWPAELPLKPISRAFLYILAGDFSEVQLLLSEIKNQASN